jgi:hypothetical protein
MKKFGIQRFLNPAGDEDTGSLSFYASSDTLTGNTPAVNGISAETSFRDCYKTISLNYSVYGVRADNRANLKKMLRDIKARRRKMLLLMNAVEDFGKKYLKALEDIERKAALALDALDEE